MHLEMDEKEMIGEQDIVEPLRLVEVKPKMEVKGEDPSHDY